MYLVFFGTRAVSTRYPEEKKNLLWGSGVLLVAADCVREKFGLLPAFAPVHASGFIGQVLAALPPATIVWLAACFRD